MSDAPEDRNRRVEEYVRGHADDETARQLEIEMLEDDDLFERVQTEDLLRRGFEETERVASSDRPKRQSGSTPLPRLGWALAASFAAVTVALGLYSSQLNERIDNLQAPSAGIPVVTLFEQRSLLPEPADSTLQLTGHKGPALLEIDVSGYSHASFQLELVRDEGNLIWEAQTPDERGYLTVMLPEAGELKSIVVRSPGGQTLKSYKLREH
ncbi:hypothetical protein [Wenzhouxiangella sp. EGI_FJ10409]|uniref:hypothetical protein n=1 Tax=Wenzhouxiangella sp. EGI_FJ10409 TaxID=3243767 RepID=UPI0035E0663B